MAKKISTQTAPSQFLMGHIDEFGKPVIPAMYEMVNAFSDGLASIAVNGLWGFIDTKNQIVVKPEYDLVGLHRHGLFPFREKGVWGIANVKGKRIIEPVYKSIVGVFEHVIVVKTSEKFTIISHSNKILIDQVDELNPWKDGVAVARVGDLCGLISDKGEWILKPQYSFIYDSREGFCAFSHNKKAGYLDTKGKVAIDAKYMEAYDFSEGLARVKLNYKFGYINTKGDLIIPCEWEGIDVLDAEFKEGKVVVAKKEILKLKYGYLDNKGKVVAPCEFDRAHSFSEGLACVVSNGVRSFIDVSGKIAFTPEMILNKFFEQGLASYHNPKDPYPQKYGFMDSKQNIVIKPILSSDAYFQKSGVAIGEISGEGFVLLNKKGEVLIHGINILPKFSEGFAPIRLANPAWDEYQENLEMDQKFLDRISKYESTLIEALAKDEPILIKGIQKFLTVKQDPEVTFIEFEIYNADDYGVVIRPHSKEGELDSIEGILKPLKTTCQSQMKYMPPEPKSRKGNRLIAEADMRNQEKVLEWFMKCWKEAKGTSYKLPAYVRMNDDHEFLNLKTGKKEVLD